MGGGDLVSPAGFLAQVGTAWEYIPQGHRFKPNRAHLFPQHQISEIKTKLSTLDSEFRS